MRATPPRAAPARTQPRALACCARPDVEVAHSLATHLLAFPCGVRSPTARSCIPSPNTRLRSRAAIEPQPSNRPIDRRNPAAPLSPRIGEHLCGYLLSTSRITAFFAHRGVASCQHDGAAKPLPLSPLVWKRFPHARRGDSCENAFVTVSIRPSPRPQG